MNLNYPICHDYTLISVVDVVRFFLPHSEAGHPPLWFYDVARQAAIIMRRMAFP